ncbi:MAG: thiamine pyrophosphate-binding protein [Alphaproteobacteria bacterium]|nr:thiamine pyrophosphate-binding protein [Alphaproteobacteria bacterium]MBU0798681.1 thiamine pyrophosphate-binding protein [Alphaproteobacteria bacterium]MBU0885944.1 thiamine pyrophosphate-binding protein [Alphaproteobacteria bacterium]MBU1811933.1 thiamine pyrophosphate-binding protein [Alphaproteobacteria bacterium]MBU2089353.1 thiamine pyrophosphate-binding protein [Alphaproteobacteria bacterium]
MTVQKGTRTGGQLIVDALQLHGVELAFGVAGESYLEVLDALVDAPSIKYVTCRQEGGAANMAEAYGKLTGKPGVCMVTRGPGATNASIGIHTAFQDSTPMVVLVGQVARDQFGREAFQEIDYRRFFAPVAKWVEQIDDAERIPEIMHRAFHIASSGRPGPVVIALPEDMLRDNASSHPAQPYQASRAHPGSGDIETLRGMLAKAKKPILLVGGSGWSDQAAKDISAFAEANNLPVCCSFRRQDVVSTRHPGFIGDLGTGTGPKLLARVKESDLLIVAGARLGEMTTQGYSLMPLPEPAKTMIHIHPDPIEIGRTYRPELGIVSGMPELAAALAATKPLDSKAWAGWTKEARAEFTAWFEPEPYKGSYLDAGKCMLALREMLPDDAIVTVDAGNFSGWPQRFLNFGRPGRLLGPTSGAMGYSVPAGVAASITYPGRVVVSCVGDGGFGMTGQELATAMHHKATPIILVFNNGMYGTIRMHQEKRFPDRRSATDLTNPDYAMLAKAHGAYGETVTKTEDFAPAFQRALKSGKAAIIELQTDPEQISTRTTISALKAAAKKA